MMIATMHDALPIYGYAALSGLAALLLVAGAWWIWHGDELRGRPSGLRLATAVVVAIASLPAWVFTVLAVLFGLATAGCAPDSYECPV